MKRKQWKRAEPILTLAAIHLTDLWCAKKWTRTIHLRPSLEGINGTKEANLEGNIQIELNNLKKGIKWEDGNIRLVNKNGNSFLGSEIGVNDRSVDIPLKRWLENI